MNYNEKPYIKFIASFFIGAYLFMLSWDGFFLSSMGIQFSPSYVVLIFIASIFVIISLRTKGYSYLPVFLWPLIIIMIYSTITLFWTPVFNPGLSTVVTLWIYLISFVLIYTIVMRVNINVVSLMWSYSLGALTVGIYSWSVGYFTRGQLAYAEGANPSYFAAFLAFAIIAAVAVLTRVKNSGRFIAFMMIVPITVLLLLTQGRNSIIALSLSFMIALVAFYISIDWSRNVVAVKKINIYQTSGSLIMFLLFIVFIVGTLCFSNLHEDLSRIALISELAGGDMDRATAGRISIWANYGDLIYPTAAIGGGVRSSGHLYQELYGHHRSPHNVFLLAWIEFGISGFFLWLAFLGSLIKYSLFNITRSFTVIWLAFFFLLFGIGNDILYYKYWWIGVLLLLLLIADTKKAEDYNAEVLQSKEIKGVNF